MASGGRSAHDVWERIWASARTGDAMPTVLITGASRGLGAEMVRQYAGAGWDVIACSRKPDAAAMRGLVGNVTQHALDVTDFAAVGQLASKLSGARIDVLVNNAGIAGRAAGELNAIDTAVWQHTMLVNALSPLKVAEAFVEHVAGSTQKKMIAITSRLGSIGLNDSGGARFAYRASKTALNMHWKSLSNDLQDRGVICTVLHPGWVRTDMGGAAAPVSPGDSVAGMIRVIAGLKPSNTGGFFNYDGTALPW
jgi:NAD(P)-dependent dehydrogenase (short-subunit alcohol dehydrogenase family)